MATNQNKKLLTWSQVKNEAKKYNIKETYTLRNGSIIKFYPHFSNTKIKELLEDYQTLIMEKPNGKDIELSDEMALNLIQLLIIKHFTHLKKYIKGNILDHIEAIEILDNNGYFSEIIEEVFLPEEVSKVYDKMSDILAQSKILDDIILKANNRAEELKEKNKVILNQIDKVSNRK